METLKKLTEEFKTNLTGAIESVYWKELITKTKAADDSGTFEVVISTSDFDRAGESVDQSGWDLANYKSNPIVLWGHDYYALPIGICDSIELVNGKLVAKGRFATADANPFAQQVRKLYDQGIIRATSVGFIVKQKQGKVITKAELLEFSFVPVPANPYALSLSMAKEIGLDLEMLSMKGVVFKSEEGEGAAADEAEVPNIETPAEEVPATPTEEVVETPASEEEAPAPVVDTPSEVPAETTIDEKGAVTDELNAEQMYEMKWENLDAVWDVINALFTVYLDESTPVENFPALLSETINLLGNIVASGDGEGEAMQSTLVASAMEANTAEKHVSRSSKGMQGAYMQIAELMKGATGINVVVSETPKNSKGEESAQVEPNSLKVEVAVDDEVKNFDQFQLRKHLLRAVVTAAQKSLERINNERKAAV